MPGVLIDGLADDFWLLPLDTLLLILLAFSRLIFATSNVFVGAQYWRLTGSLLVGFCRFGMVLSAGQHIKSSESSLFILHICPFMDYAP